MVFVRFLGFATRDLSAYIAEFEITRTKDFFFSALTPKSTVESLEERLWVVETRKTIQWLNGRRGCSVSKMSKYLLV